MRNLLDQIAKTYELKQIEESLNKIETIKKDIQFITTLGNNSITR